MKNIHKYSNYNDCIYDIAEPIFSLKYFTSYEDDEGYGDLHWLGETICDYGSYLDGTYGFGSSTEAFYEFVFEHKDRLKEDISIDDNKIKSFLMLLTDYVYSSKCQITEKQKDKMNFIITREIKNIKNI